MLLFSLRGRRLGEAHCGGDGDGIGIACDCDELVRPDRVLDGGEQAPIGGGRHELGDGVAV